MNFYSKTEEFTKQTFLATRRGTARHCKKFKCVANAQCRVLRQVLHLLIVVEQVQCRAEQLNEAHSKSITHSSNNDNNMMINGHLEQLDATIIHCTTA